jgi:hypothetical protein
MAEAFHFIENPDTKAGSQKPQCPCHLKRFLGYDLFMVEENDTASNKGKRSHPRSLSPQEREGTRAFGMRRSQKLTRSLANIPLPEGEGPRMRGIRGCHQYITNQILGTEIFELSKPGLCMR